MQPVNDYVLILPEIVAKKSSLLVIPESAQERSNVGKVIAVGPKVTQVTEGDVVMVKPSFMGMPVDVGGITHNIIQEHTILGILS